MVLYGVTEVFEAECQQNHCAALAWGALRWHPVLCVEVRTCITAVRHQYFSEVTIT
jgi:hypothetical protein